MLTEQRYADTDNRRSGLVLVLFFLLLSFSCIFCSSQLALWAVDRDQIAMGIRPKQTADYRGGPAMAVAPLSGDIAAEAARDEDRLSLAITPQKQGLPVALLPIPRNTPTPTPIPTPTPTPTPTPQAIAVVSPAPVSPTPTAAVTPAQPGATTTASPPTAPPSTVTATAPAATTPTVTPAGPTVTASPTTRPTSIRTPTSVSTATATATPVDTATATATATDTATATATDTATATATATDTATATATDTATATATNTPTSTPVPPDIAFAAASFSVNENVTTGQAVITTTLSSTFAHTVTVNYASSDSTALAGQDYTAVSGQLVFTPGQTSQTFAVPITNDNITNELSEELTLTLTNAVSATLSTPNPVTLSIADDDGQPTVSFAAAEYSVNEGDSLGGVDIGVRLSAPSSITVSVDFDTQDQGATAGSDYTATSGTLTFAPGQQGQSFRVTVISDTTTESPDEDVDLLLSNPISATVGTSPISLIIVDDDPSAAAGTCPLLGPVQESLPNIGDPDGEVAGIYCGTEMIVPVVPTTTIVTDGTNAYDMVYYEYLLTSGSDGSSCLNNEYIYLDWVTVQVGTSAAGPWYTVFLWGDGVADTNTNMSVAGSEQNNRVVCAQNLYGGNTGGIAIDVDAKAPPGIYRYVRLFVPAGPDPSGNLDSLQLDALDSLP